MVLLPRPDVDAFAIAVVCKARVSAAVLVEEDSSACVALVVDSDAARPSVDADTELSVLLVLSRLDAKPASEVLWLTVDVDTLASVVVCAAWVTAAVLAEADSSACVALVADSDVLRPAVDVDTEPSVLLVAASVLVKPDVVVDTALKELSQQT